MDGWMKRGRKGLRATKSSDILSKRKRKDGVSVPCHSYHYIQTICNIPTILQDETLYRQRTDSSRSLHSFKRGCTARIMSPLLFEKGILSRVDLILMIAHRDEETEPNEHCCYRPFVNTLRNTLIQLNFLSGREPEKYPWLIVSTGRLAGRL